MVGEGVVHGGVDQTREDGRVGDHLVEHRALGEQPVRVGLLEVAGADLLAGDVRGDREHRGPGAVGVVQAVDQVQVARAAGTGADRQLTGELGVRGGGEGGRLLVSYVDPVDPTVGRAAGTADGVDDRIERVADDPVDATDTGLLELSDELFGELHRACTS
ncbi:hypothetical protein SDC9_86049 [bioreactor metagenome]|uniref:Uncharacterized protein n=1 Tax=bioreactor metagenome TaxID=1076179 RepID=A0A644ZEY5_9ZZZZ